jgi:NAD dependent epimerase/dehydratase family enzyme
VDAVVHLAGENIGAGRWTAEKKRRIRESRVGGTQLLAKALSRLFDPPKVFISVSAIGYYGNRGDERLEEDSDAGIGFLPQVCQEWEAATEAAMIRGIRVVIPRLGMVLSAKALLDKNIDASEEEIKEGISGNLCRCTGYKKIVDGVKLAQTRLKNS